MSTVLVVSPHPDDETLGCGGTIRTHVLDGDRVVVVFLTSGEGGGHGRDQMETARIREAEARVAGAQLGVAEQEFWREPDGGLRATATLVDRLRNALAADRPDVVYVTHGTEMHPDHRAAYRIVIGAVRRLGPDDRPVILAYEIWSPLGRMDHIVDISPVVDDKIAAIRAYRTQCAVLRFDDAFLALARYRGEMHQWPGGDYAEIFVRAGL